MADVKQKIPLNLLSKCAKEHSDNSTVKEWFDIRFEIKRSLGLTDALRFVNDVVTNCFDKSGSYIPEVMDFVIKSNILERYTNLTLPKDLERLYDLIYRTNIVDTVCHSVNAEQLHEIVSAINRKIGYLCDVRVYEARQKINEALSVFEKIEEQTGEIFSGISRDDVENLLGAITNGKFSEEKLVEAYTKRIGNGTDAEPATLGAAETAK